MTDANLRTVASIGSRAVVACRTSSATGSQSSSTAERPSRTVEAGLLACLVLVSSAGASIRNFLRARVAEMTLRTSSLSCDAIRRIERAVGTDSAS